MKKIFLILVILFLPIVVSGETNCGLYIEVKDDLSFKKNEDGSLVGNKSLNFETNTTNSNYNYNIPTLGSVTIKNYDASKGCPDVFTYKLNSNDTMIFYYYDFYYYESNKTLSEFSDTVKGGLGVKKYCKPNSSNTQCEFAARAKVVDDYKPSTKYAGDYKTCDEGEYNSIYECGCIPAQMADLSSTAYFVLKIVGPVLLLILGGIDMAKAIATEDDSAIKKAKTKLIKKAISAASIFVVLSIFQFVITLVIESEEFRNQTLECLNYLLNGYDV